MVDFENAGRVVVDLGGANTAEGKDCLPLDLAADDFVGEVSRETGGAFLGSDGAVNVNAGWGAVNVFMTSAGVVELVVLGAAAVC